MGVLGAKMMHKKALYFYFCHATDTDFCARLLTTITTYYCLTLKSAEAPLENNSKDEYLGIMINGITIKYLSMND